MTKVINHPITVTIDRYQKPLNFAWGKERFQVINVLEKWVESGEWWDGACELHVYRVLTHPHGVFEIHIHSPDEITPDSQKYSHQSVKGMLYRVYD